MRNAIILVHRTNRKHAYYTALYRKLRRSKSPIISNKTPIIKDVKK
jgi:hypothetical protein